MIDFVYKRLLFNIRELLYVPYADRTNRKCDLTFYHNVNGGQLDLDRPFLSKSQFTLTTNLLGNEGDLFKNVKKGCRYDIRRAEAEGVSVDLFDCAGKTFIPVLNEFRHTYNMMFKTKNMKNRFNIKLIKAAMKSGHCVVFVAKNSYKSHPLFVFHAYLVDDRNAMLLYSTSNIWRISDKDAVAFIGRMNKHLHWKAMLHFKNNGYDNYEWGGISDPEHPNGIDKFKMEFGGRVCSFDNYIISNTALGNLYLRLIGRKNRY